jgi:hypothetical protein
MNTSVQAGAMIVSLAATMIDAAVSTLNEVNSYPTLRVDTTCLALSIISINGHSLSAINPDVLIGGEATLIAA